MSLAAPSSLTITRLRAVGVSSLGQEQSLSAKDVKDEWLRPRGLNVYGLAKWTNTEAAEHQVEITTGCSLYCAIGTWNQTQVLPKGSNSAWVLLAKFDASVGLIWPNASVSIRIFNQAGSTSTAVTSTINLVQLNGTTPADFTGAMSLSFGTSLAIPAWTPTLGMPQVEIWENLGTPSQKKLSVLEATSESVVLPSGLKPLNKYQAVLVAGAIFRPKVETFAPSLLLPYFSLSELRTQTLEFIAPDAAAFSVTSKTARVIKNQSLNILLEASHAATFQILSGAPAGVSISQSKPLPDGKNAFYLVGTPQTAGSFAISIEGTRTSDSVTATGTISLAVLDSGDIERVAIVVNPGWLNNGLSYVVGDRVLLQLASVPTDAKWKAVGLPPGLNINEDSGVISGVASSAGRFLASFVAAPSDPASLLLESLPATITFTIRDGQGGDGGTTPSNPAITRIPWILSKWTLTDLQVLARTRAVQSTLLDAKNGIRLKVGDNINFAVFFVGADDRPFELAPSRLRLTIRPADNLEGSLVFDSEETPAAVTTEPDPYYLLAVSTAGRQRQIVQEWVEDTGKNDPLPCVADIDWIKDDQHFSSASFPVLLDLDVTRP